MTPPVSQSELLHIGSLRHNKSIWLKFCSEICIIEGVLSLSALSPLVTSVAESKIFAGAVNTSNSGRRILTLFWHALAGIM